MEGIAEDQISNQYYAVIEGMEYLFKYIAHWTWEAAAKAPTESAQRQFMFKEN